MNEESLKYWEQEHIELLTSREMGEWLHRRDTNARLQDNITEEDIQNAIKAGYENGYSMAQAKYQRSQGEREFIEILAEYLEDDYDTLPEYKGKPYYSIHYRENGEEFVGYGTYKIEVLSKYLRNYFFSADMIGKEEE